MQFQETLHPDVSTEISATAGADYVLFCVKTTDTASVSKELAKYISPSTVVLSLQNGVNNAEEIRKASGIEAIPTVVRSEEHTSELQSPDHLVCRLLLEKKKTRYKIKTHTQTAVR